MCRGFDGEDDFENMDFKIKPSTLHVLANDMYEKNIRQESVARSTYRNQLLPDACWNCKHSGYDYDRMFKCGRTGDIWNDKDVMIVNVNGICDVHEEDK